jgi:signal transduction histidine kinase/CheY-like chemotaxis protein
VTSSRRHDAAQALAAAGAGRLSLDDAGLLRADATARALLGVPLAQAPLADVLATLPAAAALPLQRALADAAAAAAPPLSLLLCVQGRVLHLQGSRVDGELLLLVLPAPAEAAPLDFLAAASHELRTPLQALLGFVAQARAGDTSGTSRDQRAWDGLDQAAELLRQRVDDLLDFSRLRAGRLDLAQDQPIDLQALFDRLAALGDSLRGSKPLRIRLRPDANAPRHLRGDARRLEQVLVNLLGNAIKYTDAGAVTIQSRVRGRREGHVTLRLAVADTGRGIAFEQLDRVGRPFEQAGGDRPGSGLGLAVVQEMLGLFGSTLRLASVAGGGSIFWFDVELAVDAAAAVPAPVAPPAAPVRTVPVRVLVVDDSPIVQMALEGQLDAMGVQVATAGDVAGALALGRRQAFDLVLADLQLDGSSGLDLLRQWRQLPVGQATPFALLSGHIGDEQRAQAQALGVRECLLKPCRSADLQALIHALPVVAAPPLPVTSVLWPVFARTWQQRRPRLMAAPPGSAGQLHELHGLRGELALLPGPQARAALQLAAALDDELRAGGLLQPARWQGLLAQVDALAPPAA